jgi:hypothetical protein
MCSEVARIRTVGKKKEKFLWMQRGSFPVVYEPIDTHQFIDSFKEGKHQHAPNKQHVQLSERAQN